MTKWIEKTKADTIILVFIYFAIVLLVLSRTEYYIKADTNTGIADSAEDFRYTETDSEICITGLAEKGYTEIVIPQRINGVSVTRIGKYAFKNNETITKVVIPGSVKVIENEAFCYCINLSDVYVEEGVEEIYAGCFDGCSKIEEIVLPNSLKLLGNNNFRGSSLRKISLPFIGKSRNESDEFALFGFIFGEGTYRDYGTVKQNSKIFCIPESLEEVTVTDATSIGDYAFVNCSFIKKIELNEGVKAIGKYAFSGCGVSSFLIPESVDKISTGAFSSFQQGQGRTLYTSKDTYGYEYAKENNLSVITTKSIELEKEKITLFLGENIGVFADVHMINGKKDTFPEIEWDSSDLNVVTVDEGYIETVGVGVAEIEAACDGIVAKCVVEVLPVKAEKITIDNPISEIQVNGKNTITATITPQNTTDKSVSWKSSNEEIAIVNGSGVVIGVSKGTAIITATTENGKSDFFLIEVIPEQLKEISFLKNAYNVDIGGKEQLGVKFVPETAENKEVIWSSSDESVAIVNDKGVVLGVSEGSAVISVESNSGITASVTIKVIDGKRINEETVPDTIFREIVLVYDTNMDGFLSLAEANRVEKLDLSQKGIKDLKGIEVFKQLKSLKCDNNDIKELDLSGNPELVELQCNENESLVSVNVTGCTKLEELVLRNNEFLRSLDVKSNTKLRVLEAFDNSINELDLSNNTELERLDCGNSFFSSLILKNHPKLAEIYCTGTFLRVIDLSGAINLKELICEDCWLEEIDVSNNKELLSFHAYGNHLRRVDLSNNTKIEELSLDYNYMSEVDVSSCMENLLNCKKFDYSKDIDRERKILYLDMNENDSSKVYFKKTDVKVSFDEAVYDGTAKTPTPNVYVEDVKLQYGRDYSIEYSNNIESGTAMAIITGEGTYVGTEKSEFIIQPKPLESSMISDISECEYNGSAIKPTAVVACLDKELILNKDYKISYKANTNAGTASVIIAGVGNYTGTVVKYFTINPTTIVGAKVSGLSIQAYTGQEIKPEPQITIGLDKRVLTKNKDYSLAYSNNTKTGTATVTIKGKGNYKGNISKTFKIVNIAVNYRAYVQKKGWMSYAKNGTTAGTTNNLRMETIQMNLTGNKNVTGGIKYRAYVQKQGWTQWADTAKTTTYAGTKGKSLRVESIQIKAYDQVAQLYDVYYRVYTDKYGWLDWAKNGATAGTAGLSYKLRAFQVKMVAKGGKAPGKTTKPYATNKNP